MQIPEHVSHPAGHHDVYAQSMAWTPIAELHGFAGSVPTSLGHFGKYFGRPGDPAGPWFYMIKHPPYTRVPRHSHASSVIHYLLEGSWLVGDDEMELCLPGFFHFEDAGAFWGPTVSGSEGSTFIAVYNGFPDFLAAADHEAGYVDLGRPGERS